MQYTTLSTLKDFLWVTDNSRDTELTNRITIMSDILSMELWQDLTKWTVTKRYDGFGSNKIVLETVVNEVQKIEYTTNNGYNRNEAEYSHHDWYIVYTRSPLPRGSQCVKVTFEKWYDVVPPDLEQFFLRYVKVATEQEQSSQAEKDIKTKKLDGLSITYFWPWEIAERNKAFWVDYDAIKNKYKVFSYFAWV